MVFHTIRREDGTTVVPLKVSVGPDKGGPMRERKFF